MTALKVVKVMRGVDMRGRHAVRKLWRNRLNAGEVVVLLNGDLTIARLIDPQGGVHDYYAPPRERFDGQALYRMAASGMRIQLQVGKDEWGEAAAPLRRSA